MASVGATEEIGRSTSQEGNWWHSGLESHLVVNHPYKPLRDPPTSIYRSKPPRARMPDGKKKIPKPGPAKLSKNADIDEWLQCAFNNQYLPEQVMKKLCEICKEFLMEG